MLKILYSILLILACNVFRSTCFPQGAPLSACASMMPGHGVAPLADPSPFLITASPNPAQDSYSYNVAIVSPSGVGFKGFLIQAKTPDGRAVGAWKTSTRNTKTIDCFNAKNVRFRFFTIT